MTLNITRPILCDLKYFSSIVSFLHFDSKTSTVIFTGLRFYFILFYFFVAIFYLVTIKTTQNNFLQLKFLQCMDMKLQNVAKSNTMQKNRVIQYLKVSYMTDLPENTAGLATEYWPT